MSLILLGLAWFTVSERRRQGGPVELQLPADSRAYTALQAALCVFWDASVFFSFGVTIAGFVVYFTDNTQYNEGFRPICTSTAMLVPVVLWYFCAKVCSYRGCRRAILHLSVLLAVVASPNWIHMVRDVPRKSACYVPSPAIYPYNFASSGFCIVFLSFRIFSYVGVLWRFPWKRQWKQPNGPGQCLAHVLTLFVTTSINPVRAWCKDPKGYWRAATIFMDTCTPALSMALLYLSFSLFIQTRIDMDNAMHGKLQQGHWGFGQVLAVTAWIPTVLELYAIGKGTVYHEFMLLGQPSTNKPCRAVGRL